MSVVIRGIRAFRVGRWHDTDAATEATDTAVVAVAYGAPRRS